VVQNTTFAPWKIYFSLCPTAVGQTCWWKIVMEKPWFFQSNFFTNKQKFLKVTDTKEREI